VFQKVSSLGLIHNNIISIRKTSSHLKCFSHFVWQSVVLELTSDIFSPILISALYLWSSTKYPTNLLRQRPLLLLHFLHSPALWWRVMSYLTEFRRFHFSSVSMVCDYRLDERETVVRSPAEAKNFSSSLCVQTSYEAHPASYPMGNVVLSRGKSRPGRNADHSPPSIA
jgi:hypothetical protein